MIKYRRDRFQKRSESESNIQEEIEIFKFDINSNERKFPDGTMKSFVNGNNVELN